MRSVFEQVIARGNYDLAGLLAKIDSYHIEGKISDADRDALYTMARQGAEPQYDIVEEINLLWSEVRKLSAEVAQLRSDTENDAIPSEVIVEPEDEWSDFVPPTGAHDSYNTGDKVTFNGKHYICKFDNTVWAPDVYPDAWEAA